MKFVNKTTRKKTIVYSILRSKCPQCRNGKLFKDSLSFHLIKTTKTNTNCEYCGLKFMREPSFFYGAMYIGYALSVMLGLIFYLIGAILLDLKTGSVILFLSMGLVILSPWSLRLARTIWIHLFVKYKPNNKDWIP